MQPSDPNPDSAHNVEPTPGGEPSQPDVRFEPRDVRFRWVVLCAVVGCVVIAGLFLFVRAVFWATLDSRFDGQPSAQSAPTESPTTQMPPEPRLELLDRLEKTPASNVAKWEQGEEKALETYAPSDEKGFVHIPLKRAMDMLAGHLPARKDADRPKFKDRGLVDAGESNSGRLFRGASK